MSDKNRIRLKILGYIVLCLIFISNFLIFDDNNFIQGCNLFCAIASMNFAYDYRKELIDV